VRIEKVDLPGIGTRHDVVTEQGRRIGAVIRCDSRRTRPPRSRGSRGYRRWASSRRCCGTSADSATAKHRRSHRSSSSRIWRWQWRWRSPWPHSSCSSSTSPSPARSPTPQSAYSRPPRDFFADIFFVFFGIATDPADIVPGARAGRRPRGAPDGDQDRFGVLSYTRRGYRSAGSLPHGIPEIHPRVSASLGSPPSTLRPRLSAVGLRARTRAQARGRTAGTIRGTSHAQR